MFEELIKSIIKRYLKVINFEAVVISVDKTNDTCVVEPVDAPEITGVKLKSIISDATSKLIVYPKVNSYVTISLLHNLETEAYVTQVSEVDEIVTNCDKVTYNGGTNEGLVKVVSLTDKLNLIENKVNDIISKFNSHVHPVTAIASPTGTSTVTIAGSLSTTSKDDIQNTNIKH